MLSVTKKIDCVKSLLYFSIADSLPSGVKLNTLRKDGMNSKGLTFGVRDKIAMPSAWGLANLDGGKVRLRNETKGEGCYWRYYKAVCLNNVYSGAFFQNNQDLIDWTNNQKLLHPMYCRLRWSCRALEHI